jgi:prepilin-type N-terminal cleavage/methylation domain-containing protein
MNPVASERGFTLIEVIVAITLAGLVALAIAIPLAATADTIGAIDPDRAITLSNLLAGEAESVNPTFNGQGETLFASTLVACATASPVVYKPPERINGDTYTYARSCACVAADLATPDPLCAAGYGRIDVTVAVDVTSASVSFIVTPGGLE